MTPYPKYPYVQGMALEDYFAGLDRYHDQAVFFREGEFF